MRKLTYSTLFSIKTMASFTSKSNTHYHVRSVSLPARSHPTTIKIEQVLNKLKTHQEASFGSYGEAAYSKLSGLIELYEPIEELLALQLNRLALAQNQFDNRVSELLDESVRFIDICSNTRDMVMLTKQAVKDVQSALRRSKIGVSEAGYDVAAAVAAYARSRKKMQKGTAKFLTVLKQIDGRLMATPLSDTDDQFCGTLKLLREASLVTVWSFQSLLMFLSVPVTKPKPTRWSLVSKLVQKGALAFEGGQRIGSKLNEMENVDIALGKLCGNGEADKIELTEKRLKALEASIEDLENVLEQLFRHLIRTRVSLLNIFSQ